MKTNIAKGIALGGLAGLVTGTALLLGTGLVKSYELSTARDSPTYFARAAEIIQRYEIPLFVESVITASAAGALAAGAALYVHAQNRL